MLQRGRSRCKASLATHLHLVVIAAQGPVPLPTPSPCRCLCSHPPDARAVECHKNPCEQERNPCPKLLPSLSTSSRAGHPPGQHPGAALGGQGCPAAPCAPGWDSGCQPRPSRAGLLYHMETKGREKWEKHPALAVGLFLMHSAGKLEDFAAQKAELFSSLSRERSPPQAWAALEESLSSAAAGWR